MLTANRKVNTNIELKSIFTQEKMEDQFIEVIFKYPHFTWIGVLPILSIYQGFKISNDTDLDSLALYTYNSLFPNNVSEWEKEKELYWSEKQKGPTYDVLNALQSGNWECRVCGPVPDVNPQPSARLRDLKKMGYVISSKRLPCKHCNKQTMHDILVKLPRKDSDSNSKARTVISPKLRKKIWAELNSKDVFFDVKRNDNELVIDHKFPSQRWTSGEDINPDTMTGHVIRNKFQLLTNQSNLLKSRICDRCVEQGIRGDFLGITWFYKGSLKWEGKHKSDENGCVGCPWYDLDRWKTELQQMLKK